MIAINRLSLLWCISNIRRHLGDIRKQSGVAMLYASLFYLGEAHFGSKAIVGYFEPASGLALAALLIGGKRYIWGVLLGAILINTIFSDSVWEALVIASSDALQAFCGAWLITRHGRIDILLQSLGDYLKLILLGGCAGIAIGAIAANTVLLFSGALVPEDYFQSLVRWWMTDMLGVALIAPLIMVWTEPMKNQRRATRMAEAALALGLTIIVLQSVFLGWQNESIGLVAKGYWMFLIVSWVAIRFGPCGTSTILTMTAVYALLGATQGVGYFARDIEQTGLINYWIYMMTLSIVGMALATHFLDRKLAEVALRESNANIKAILDNSPYLSWLKDADGRYIKVNKVFVGHVGLNARQIVGKTDFDIWPKDMAEKYLSGDSEVMASRRQKHIEEELIEGSRKYWIETFKLPVIDDNDKVLGTTGFARDITERKRAEEQIHNLAFYDTLTQLPNRRMLNDRLGQVKAASKRSGHYAALLFLDLDNFKPLNDKYGHNMGDLLLIQAAQRIVGCVREEDTVARFGGDEFVVILSGLGTRKDDSDAHAGIVAEKIRNALSKPYLLAYRQWSEVEISIEHHCTSSIGIALFIGHETSPENILKQADIAMYQAKDGGRNKACFFTAHETIIKP